MAKLLVHYCEKRGTAGQSTTTCGIIASNPRATVLPLYVTCGKCREKLKLPPLAEEVEEIIKPQIGFQPARTTTVYTGIYRGNPENDAIRLKLATRKID